jgi:hypothetical protein
MTDKLSNRFILGTNAVIHVLILFTALTLLFIFIVAKTETRALQGEFDNALTDNLRKALENAEIASGGVLRKTLQPMAEPLRFAENFVDERDAETETYNQSLFVYSFIVIGACALILLTMLLVASYEAKAPGVAKAFGALIFSNVVLFVLVGGTEFVFFKRVATKYVPIKPSLITEQIIEDIKKNV